MSEAEQLIFPLDEILICGNIYVRFLGPPPCSAQRTEVSRDRETDLGGLGTLLWEGRKPTFVVISPRIALIVPKGQAESQLGRANPGQGRWPKCGSEILSQSHWL